MEEILLTYQYYNKEIKRTCFDYEWHQFEHELKDSIITKEDTLKNFEIIECIMILGCEDINIDSL